MTDITPIKPIRLCVNITIPTIDDDSISLYEAVGILANKLQEAIQKINASLGSLEGAYSAANPPPYPVTSVNGKTGAVIIDIPKNVYTVDNPPPYPVTSVNRAETKDIITVYVPEGGGIEDAKQEDLIKACKAGARLGAFDLDNKTCRLYHLNLFVDPERVEYTEVAGGGASGVQSVNDQTGAVNIFNAPISAATAASVTALQNSVNTRLSQLNANKVAYADALTLEEILASTDLTNKVAGAEAVKTVNTNKVAYTDALTLEEIMASTDLTNKIAGAQAIKTIKNDVGMLSSGNFYSEKNKGNTVPVDYGGFVRLNGKSWPGSFNGDTYYLGVGADSVTYMGVQINGAIQVTWTAI